MREVVVVGEGQTEETFVRDFLGPALANGNLFVCPRLIHTSPSSRGGALTPQRVLRFLRNTLRERKDTYVTTFFDLYGLHPDFPGVSQAARQPDPLKRATAVEAGFHETVVQEAGCRSDRFLPHIQPYDSPTPGGLRKQSLLGGNSSASWKTPADQCKARSTSTTAETRIRRPA